MKNIVFGIILISSFSCNENVQKQEQKKSVKLENQPSLKEFNKLIDSPTIVNDSLNDVARYIAGLQPLNPQKFSNKLLNDQSWINYHKQSNLYWNKYDSSRLSIIKIWREKEIHQSLPVHYNLFYPFSGPDLLNAIIFFPEADTILMIGLEPTGKFPTVYELEKDTILNYLNRINKSLYSILNFSFFRTIAMNSDLKQQDLNGTTQLITLFIERCGGKICNISHLNIDSTGMISISKSPTFLVKINWLDKAAKNKTVYYMSKDISDLGLKRKYWIAKFMSKLSHKVTYLKSASYLLHKEYFRNVREIILSQSQAVLQDDSGIPYRFFGSQNWQTQLYGNYIKPIDLFGGLYQDNLKNAYDSLRKNIKPLPFGIGYQHHKWESNLIFAKRK